MKEKIGTVKVSKAFKQSVARWLDLTTLESREKHLNLLSHGGVLFLINPGTTIRYTVRLTQTPKSPLILGLLEMNPI